MIVMSTSLIKLDCSGVTTENSATCVIFVNNYGDSVVLVFLTATFLLIIFAVPVNLSNGVTVTVVLYSDG